MRSTFGAFVVPCLFAAILSAQKADVVWTKRLKFSDADKRELIALAKKMGVDDPASVDANLRDDCCRIVSVKSRIVEDGPERRWMQALMIRTNWREHGDARFAKDRLRVGQWVADDSPPQVFAGWRVRDGEWFVDVGENLNNPDVPYRDAELIMLALHRGKVVNRLPERTINGNRVQPSIPPLKGGMPYTFIRQPRSDASGSEYLIFIGAGRDGGITLTLRIVGDTVEAVALGVFEV